MQENKTEFPDWVTDKKAFANYMEDISFFEKPFSWETRNTVEECAVPTPAAPVAKKQSLLSALVGLMFRSFIDDMKWWF